MRLDGKVNKIERIVGTFRHGEVADEKRVFHLNVRLPDKSLQAAYTYGYGQMHFILHGRAMEDFVDLGGEVDIYVLRKDAKKPSYADYSDLLSQIYTLEGDVKTLTTANETLKKQAAEKGQENQTLRERLRAAMDEVMRLEAHLGVDPPAPPQLEAPNE